MAQQFIILSISVALSTGCAAFPIAAAANEVKLHVIDVGQGDGILLECADGSVGMIVDSADPRESDGGIDVWKAYIAPFLNTDTSIPLVVASHPHADHIGGLPWLLKTYDVDLLVDNGRPYNETATFKAYKDERDELKISQYEKASTWPMSVDTCGGDVTITFWVAPGFSDSKCKRDANLCSVFTRIDHGNISFLLTGDAHDESELAVLNSDGMEGWLDVDVLKVGHHGSFTSSAPEFLQAASPECALISSGDYKKSKTNKRVEKNGKWSGYGHPRKHTLEKLNIALLWTNNVMRSEKVKAWDTSSDKWVSQSIRTGISVTALDGNLVVRSSGSDVTCPH